MAGQACQERVLRGRGMNRGSKTAAGCLREGGELRTNDNESRKALALAEAKVTGGCKYRVWYSGAEEQPSQPGSFPTAPAKR